MFILHAFHTITKAKFKEGVKVFCCRKILFGLKNVKDDNPFPHSIFWKITLF